ncbi:MAG: hypothetical protein ACXV97_03770 [Chthoniobacterales bacterium]
MKKILCLLLLLLSMAAAHAGLKEWIHGSQPAATPGPPEAKVADVSFAAGVATDKTVLDFMVALTEALRVHDGNALKPRLSAKFTIEDLPSDVNAVDLLMQGITRGKAPKEIVITSVETDGDARVAKAEFRSADRPPKMRTFHFDADGKLVTSDLFQVQRHGFFSH